jgi:hypothetical protein
MMPVGFTVGFHYSFRFFYRKLRQAAPPKRKVAAVPEESRESLSIPQGEQL